MKNRTLIVLTAVTAVALTAGLAVAVYAAANPQGWGMMGGAGSRPAVVGKVTAIDGSMLTVISVRGMWPNASSSPSSSAASGHFMHPERIGASTTTYTVDISNATIKKNNVTSTISAISVGDTVVVEGTISGTSVTASVIVDGMGIVNGSTTRQFGRPFDASATASSSPSVGNGSPHPGFFGSAFGAVGGFFGKMFSLFRF